MCVLLVGQVTGTLSGGELWVWNQNWNVGYNDKRGLWVIQCCFLHVICLVLFINKVDPDPALIRPHNKAILATRDTQSDHILSLWICLLKIEKLFLNHFNNLSHSASSLSNVGTVRYLLGDFAQLCFDPLCDHFPVLLKGSFSPCELCAVSDSPRLLEGK